MKAINQSDLDFMRHALALAKQGEFTVHPNPRVGCVLVQNHQIVGEGIHWKTGSFHAECHALQQAQEKAFGATCYVTLEPCAHQGRTGPCVNALIESGVSTVVIASIDPNPLVAGKGVQALEAAGVKVHVGLLKEEAQDLNRGFYSRMLRGRPYIRAKMGMSLDGRIAMASGESQWITSDASRATAHLWRARSGAILTTNKTVNRDNCRLTVRNTSAFAKLPQGINFVQPLRVVVDSDLSVSPKADIFQQPGKTVIAISDKVSSLNLQTWLAQLGEHQERLEYIVSAQKHGHIDITAVLHWLGMREINDVLVEAGSTFTGALLQAGLIDELLVFIAPKFLGQDALPMINLPGLIHLSEHVAGSFEQVQQLGTDLHVVVKLSDFGSVEHDNS